MEMIKRSERTIHAGRLISNFRDGGYKVKELGEFKKWKDLKAGGRITESMTVYEVDMAGTVVYIMEDSLGMVAAQMTQNRNEVFDWLKENEYKTAEKFYTEDYGMTKEDWEEWNRG